MFSRDDIYRNCYIKALYAFGTSKIYSLKAAKRDKWIKVNTCLGILLPSFVGGIVLTWGKEMQNLDYVIWGAGLLGLLQLILSIIALVFGWEESKNYYMESTIANRNLQEDFIALVEFPPTSDIQLKTEYDKLVYKEVLRNNSDDKYPFTLKEERLGMRYALRNFQRPCATCNLIPTSMKSTNCDTCGNF